MERGSQLPSRVGKNGVGATVVIEALDWRGVHSRPVSCFAGPMGWKGRMTTGDGDWTYSLVPL